MQHLLIAGKWFIIGMLFLAAAVIEYIHWERRDDAERNKS